ETCQDDRPFKTSARGARGSSDAEVSARRTPLGGRPSGSVVSKMKAIMKTTDRRLSDDAKVERPWLSAGTFLTAPQGLTGHRSAYVFVSLHTAGCPFPAAVTS